MTANDISSKIQVLQQLVRFAWNLVFGGGNYIFQAQSVRHINLKVITQYLQKKFYSSISRLSLRVF